MTTSDKVLSEFNRYGNAMAKVGYAVLYINHLCRANREVAVQVSWSAQGGIDASEALTFASDLMACTHLALECERLLTEKGYVIWREEK